VSKNDNSKNTREPRLNSGGWQENFVLHQIMVSEEYPVKSELIGIFRVDENFPGSAAQNAYGAATRMRHYVGIDVKPSKLPNGNFMIEITDWLDIKKFKDAFHAHVPIAHGGGLTNHEYTQQVMQADWIAAADIPASEKDRSGKHTRLVSPGIIGVFNDRESMEDAVDYLVARKMIKGEKHENGLPKYQEADSEGQYRVHISRRTSVERFMKTFPEAGLRAASGPSIS